MRIKIVVAAGLALTAIAVFVMLLHAPATVIATNGVPPATELGIVKGSSGLCQRGEVLPGGTSAIRLTITATTGPRVDVEVLEGSRILTRGTQGTAWFGSAVTIPIRPPRRTVSHATVCFQFSLLSGYLQLPGAQTIPTIAATSGGKTLRGRVAISYLRASGPSWWSLAGAVVQRMSLGRAASGTWIVLPIAALGAAAFALAAWLVVRELG